MRWKTALAGGLPALALISAAPVQAAEFWQVDADGATAVFDASALKTNLDGHRLATFYFVLGDPAASGPTWLTERKVEMDCIGHRVRGLHIRELDRRLVVVSDSDAHDRDLWEKADDDEMGTALVSLACVSAPERPHYGKRLQVNTLREAISFFAARISVAPASSAVKDPPEKPSCAPGGSCSGGKPEIVQETCDANGLCDAVAREPKR